MKIGVVQSVWVTATGRCSGNQHVYNIRPIHTARNPNNNRNPISRPCTLQKKKEKNWEKKFFFFNELYFSSIAASTSFASSCANLAAYCCLAFCLCWNCDVCLYCHLFFRKKRLFLVHNTRKEHIKTNNTHNNDECQPRWVLNDNDDRFASISMTKISHSLRLSNVVLSILPLLSK